MTAFGRALSITFKDIESYYGKPPLVTWGLLFPAVLMLAVYLKDPGTYLAVAPGIIAMTLLFGNTSMGAIVITFEKRSGTFQRLLLAPLTPRTILAGKAVGAGVYGLATSLVLAGALALFLRMPLAHPFLFAAALLLGGAIFSLWALIVSMLVREVFEAMTLLNFLRFPLLFISGVFMPVSALPGWAKPIVLASPLTYIVELLRFAIFGQCYFPSPWVPVLAAAAFLVVTWFIAGPAFRVLINR